MEGANEVAGGDGVKAEVIALVNSYAYDLADAPQVDGFYDDATWDSTRWGVTSQVTLVETTRNAATYDLGIGRIYAIFYDDVMLSGCSLQDVEAAVGAAWRDTVGRPHGYVVQDQDTNHVRIFPKPDANSRDFSFLFGAPLGHDFPDRALGVVIAERREDLPAWLDVPLALGVLAREYERDSAHRDAAFAKACRDIAGDLLGWLLV